MGGAAAHPVVSKGVGPPQSINLKDKLALLIILVARHNLLRCAHGASNCQQTACAIVAKPRHDAALVGVGYVPAERVVAGKSAGAVWELHLHPPVCRVKDI